MTIIFNTEPQGSEGWLSARVGCITGSRFRDALDRKKDGGMTAEAMGYAYDLAREREGGKAPETFVNAAMRLGTQEEPVARLTYEAETGQFVEEVGFAHTEDKKFGCSVDGLVPPKGMLEIKTMVSSAVLFKAMVDGDISEYRAQCVGAMWLLSLDWCDLCLWAPDLKALHVVRIERNEDEIAKLETDLLAFDRLVESLRVKLRAKLTQAAEPVVATTPAAPAADMDAPWALPAAPADILQPTF